MIVFGSLTLVAHLAGDDDPAYLPDPFDPGLLSRH
jgi:hypothetical protein